MMGRFSLLLTLSSLSLLACASRIAVGTEDDALKHKDAGAGGVDASTAADSSVNDASHSHDAAPAVPPPTCDSLTVAQCAADPRCRTCPPNAKCATACIDKPCYDAANATECAQIPGCQACEPTQDCICRATPACSAFDVGSCASQPQCVACAPTEDCICRGKRCEELDENVCTSVKGCFVCPPNAFCGTACIGTAE